LVKNIAQADQTNLTKKHVDPNAAFPFQDDYLVRTIHGKNMAAQSNKQEKGTGTKDANATPTGAIGTAPVAAEGSTIPSSTGTKGRVDGRPGGK
jgi:hypothetical protein